MNAQLDLLSLTCDKSLASWPRRRAYECRLCRLQFGLRRAALEHAKLHSQTVKCNFCGLDCRSVEAKLDHERRQHAEDIRKAVKTRRMSKAARARADVANAVVQQPVSEAVPVFTYQQSTDHGPADVAAFASDQFATVLQCQQCQYCFTSLAALTDHVTYHCPAGGGHHQHQQQHQAQAAASAASASVATAGEVPDAAIAGGAGSGGVRLVSSNELQCIQGLYHLRAAFADELAGVEHQQQQQQMQQVYYLDSSAFEGYRQEAPVPAGPVQQQQFYYAYHPAALMQHQHQQPETVASAAAASAAPAATLLEANAHETLDVSE